MWMGVLGPLLASHDGMAIPIGAAKQRMLLATLLVRANQVVSFDELAAVLWDTPASGNARIVVRTYVRRLRQAVGPAIATRIVTRDPGYLFHAAEHELDLLRFRRLFREGGAAARTGDWPSAQAALAAGLALWRGPALVDAQSRQLHHEHVPQLEQMRLQALEWRAQAELNLGRHTEVAADLRALVTVHPLHEGLQAQLMLALYRCGQRAEALDTYREVRQRLVDELGVEPGPELQQLHQRMLQADPGLVWRVSAPPTQPAAGDPGGSPAPAIPCQVPADLPTLIGRDREVAALEGYSIAGGRCAWCDRLAWCPWWTRRPASGRSPGL